MLNAIFVILGAALWATDTIFRHPMVQQVSPMVIVYLEHAFAFAASVLAVLIFERKSLRKTQWGWRAIVGAAMIGIFGSAFATLAFTFSFQLVNPSVSILLQKIQPILVILFSAIFLGEKLQLSFFAWGALAVAAAFFLSFPNGIHSSDLSGANVQGIFLALSAAVLWAISTVIGKFILRWISGPILTMWRFLFGFITMFFLMRLIPQYQIDVPFVLADRAALSSIIFIAIIPGFLGVALYYRGLSRVKASVATILELSFPLCAVFINANFLGFTLNKIQLISATVLLLAIGMISRRKYD